MQRFFSNIDLSSILEISDKDLYNQIIRVLRSKIWENFIFFNSIEQVDYVYKLEEIKKNSLIFSLIEKIEKKESDLILNLYNSLPNKYEKIEYIVQKWTEVWISNFYFFKSERSQNLKIDIKKIERFQKIIIESSEQSWRNTIPKIHFLDKLKLENLKWENVFFHTKNENSMSLKELNLWKNINLFVWPEWGFSDEEIKNLENLWFKKVYFSWNILRTETVWVVVWFYLKQK